MYTIEYKGQMVDISEAVLTAPGYSATRVKAMAERHGLNVPKKYNRNAVARQLIEELQKRRAFAEAATAADSGMTIAEVAAPTPPLPREPSPDAASQLRREPETDDDEDDEDDDDTDIAIAVMLRGRGVTNAMLKEMLRSRNLTQSGKKDDLIQRLVQCGDLPTRKEINRANEHDTLDKIMRNMMRNMTLAEKRASVSRSVTPVPVTPFTGGASTSR